ncbi:MAG: DUF1569 domain-containing protein [Crocinitomix sp.]|nr:DUF1569 domain-containing protein [Crocinitomix sp.]
MKNIFDEVVNNEVLARINTLSNESQPTWGKMDVAQMLAHCSVAYDGVYDDARPPAKGFKKFLLKLFIKKIVVGDKPYKKNSRTAPEFLIVDKRDFNTEKERLITYLNKTQELGGSHFDGKESQSLGPLTLDEWSNMFYKHLDHHLTQFGV